jgi:hypothetical protein
MVFCAAAAVIDADVIDATLAECQPVMVAWHTNCGSCCPVPALLCLIDTLINSCSPIDQQHGTGPP